VTEYVSELTNQISVEPLVPCFILVYYMSIQLKSLRNAKEINAAVT
jgi:hypothetical protein